MSPVASSSRHKDLGTSSRRWARIDFGSGHSPTRWFQMGSAAVWGEEESLSALLNKWQPQLLPNKPKHAQYTKTNLIVISKIWLSLLCSRVACKGQEHVFRIQSRGNTFGPWGGSQPWKENVSVVPWHRSELLFPQRGPSGTSPPLVSSAPSPAPPYQHCQLEGDKPKEKQETHASASLIWLSNNIINDWKKVKKLNRTYGIFKGFKGDLLCWCPLKSTTIHFILRM